MGAMIAPQVIKKLSREWGPKPDAVEKHYILGWILYGIVKSSIARSLVFKGGTALSKIHYPSDWRLSEDLDFTVLDDIKWETIIKALSDEVPKIVQRDGKISITLRKKPHTNPDYLQAKMKYTGPLGPGTIKVEISKEGFVGNTKIELVPNNPDEFDYPEFSVNVYSVETIAAEKIRAILQRGYIRDYYDVWRLFKEKKFNQKEARKTFDDKCRTKGVKFSGIDDFFPTNIAHTLNEHLPSIMRLTREKLPPIGTILGELREYLAQFLK
jgi:hypothetical protein